MLHIQKNTTPYIQKIAIKPSPFPNWVLPAGCFPSSPLSEGPWCEDSIQPKTRGEGKWSEWKVTRRTETENADQGSHSNMESGFKMSIGKKTFCICTNRLLAVKCTVIQFPKLSQRPHFSWILLLHVAKRMLSHIPSTIDCSFGQN